MLALATMRAGMSLEASPMTYRTIFADPPWKVSAGPLNGREGFGDATGASRPLAYPSMSVEAISALQVGQLADPIGAHLYLCAINRYVDAAYVIARAWGFEPSTLLVWAKAPMGGGLGGAYGLSTEFVLFCRRGRCPALQRQTGTWFTWKRPYDKRGKPRHSAKPPGLFDLIEKVSPGPRVELFARDNRMGWDRWGNEIESSPGIADVLARTAGTTRRAA